MSTTKILTDDQIKELEADHDFRVSIFGSARTLPDTPIYEMTRNFAKTLAENNIGVVTGGGPGVMRAANEGHKAGNVSGRSKSIGLTIQLPWENTANRFVDAHLRFDRFSGRLDQFMRLSNAVVVMPGGIGTCLELFYAWQLLQVRHICDIPIITVGATWNLLIDWVRTGLLETEKTIDIEDLGIVIPVDTPDGALKIVIDAYNEFLVAGDDYCFNWRRYK